MNNELREKVEKHLRKLRAADSQAAAVAWMTQAYRLFEECLSERESPAVSRFLFVPPPPQLQIVQSVPKYGFKTVPARPTSWPGAAPTVVYPDFPPPPPRPRPWTHNDTVRLERAARAKTPPIQRRGK